MEKSDLRSALAPAHGSNTQRTGMLDHWLDQLWAGLDGLKALGHNVMVDLAGETPALQYPKVLYKTESTEETLTVNSSDEESAAKAEGWDVHPSADGGMSDGGMADAEAPVAPPPVPFTMTSAGKVISPSVPPPPTGES